MKKGITLVIILGMLFILMPNGAKGAGSVEDPCQPEINRFCRGFTPEDKQIEKCLLMVERFLSPSCQAKMNKEKTILKIVPSECEEDHQKLCRDVAYETPRIFNCFTRRKNYLSAKCSAKITELQKKIGEAVKICTPELKNFCKNAITRPEVIWCLKDNAAKVSASCKKGLEKL